MLDAGNEMMIPLPMIMMTLMSNQECASDAAATLVRVRRRKCARTIAILAACAVV